MPLNTAEELLSVLDFDIGATPGMPIPHSVGSPQKLHLLWLYGGLAPDAPPRPTTPAGSTDLPIQRWLVRSAHFDQLGESSIEDFQIAVKRGIGSNASEPFIRFRVNRDNKGFGRWIRKGLGRAGDRYTTVNIGPLGTAHVWQFEVTCDDDCDIELQGMEAIFNRIGH